ncbi:MAG TPA: histidine kinase dimerization/phospho-acceptor domain-containing protein, partial [bacterium]|nr:histidine kinase dimerization/phospho-acceptor domain-containing protein [bacterium]
MSDKKEVPETLKNTQTEKNLMIQAKWASLGHLCAGVAHELNNPLTTVLSLSELLAFSLKERLTEEQKMNFELIRESALRMKKIIGDLHTFVRSSSLNRSPLDVNLIVGKLLALESSAVKKEGIIVETQLNPVPSFSADADRLLQVFINLFSNSLDAMQGRKEKKIIIRTGYDDKKCEIRILFRDSGAGIRKEIRGRIFEKFFT